MGQADKLLNGRVMLAGNKEGRGGCVWEEGRRLLQLGVGRRTHQPRGTEPPDTPSSVQIKALSNTQGSYAYCDRCKADCRDNSLQSHRLDQSHRRC